MDSTNLLNFNDKVSKLYRLLIKQLLVSPFVKQLEFMHLKPDYSSALAKLF